MTPDEINVKFGRIAYRCRACLVDHGLQWFMDSSCPVCSNPECQKFCQDEWNQALSEASEEEDDVF